MVDALHLAIDSFVMNTRYLLRTAAWCLGAFSIGSLCSTSAFPQSGKDDEMARLSDAGQAAISAGRYAEAKSDFEQLVKLAPQVAEVHATLAAIDFKLRDYQDAISQVHIAQRLKPLLPRLDSLLALSLAESGRFQEALPGLEKGFRQSIDQDTKRLCGLQLLRSYTNLNRDVDAVTTALAMNKLYPDDPEVLYNTGRIFGNYAYVVMEKLHDSAPNSVWMIQAQAEAYESQKDYDSAIAAYRRVLTMEPDRPGIHYRIGRTYLRRFQGSHDDHDRAMAQVEFRAELTMDPQNANSAYELAQIDYDLGNLDQARSEFEELLASRADFEQAQVGLAGVLLEQQKPQLALPHLREAVKLEPTDEVAWYRMARAMRATGDDPGQQRAMAEFHRLHAVESGSPAQTGMRATEGDVTPQQLSAKESAESHP